MKYNEQGIRVINPETDFIPGTNKLKVNTPHSIRADLRNDTGIRQYMVDKGYNPEKIGYENDQVTFDNKPFMTPSYVNNGTSYASSAAIDKAAEEFNKNFTGIRQYMVNSGMDNSKIGFADGNVTYNGNFFMKPSYISDGKSHATTSEIDAAIKEYNKNNASVAVRQGLADAGFNTNHLEWNAGNNTFKFGGKEYTPDRIEDGVSYMTEENFDKFIGDMGLVRATDYIAQLGLGGGAVMTNDGQLTYMGRSVPVYQVKSDGQNTYAYVKKEDLDRIANEYKLGNPTIAGAFNNFKMYDEKIEKALDRIENAKPFEYDVEDDPNYQAYLKIAKRNAEKSYEDTLAKASAMTGGFANSNAIMAANQAKDAHLQTLQDQIPQFFNNAYNRYNAERQRDENKLARLMEVANNKFSNELQSAMQFNALQQAAEQWNFLRKQYEDSEGWKETLYADDKQKYEDEKKLEETMRAEEKERYEYQKQIDSLALLMQMMQMPVSTYGQWQTRGQDQASLYSYLANLAGLTLPGATGAVVK